MDKVERLLAERDALRKQVNDLAKFNHAREPEYVWHRRKLREALEEVAALRRRVTSMYMLPIIKELNQIQCKLDTEAKDFEGKAHAVANEFLEGKKDYDTFLEEFIDIRTKGCYKRALEVSLSKDKEKLAQSLPNLMTKQNRTQSDVFSPPVPMPRQRKRVSFNK